MCNGLCQMQRWCWTVAILEDHPKVARLHAITDTDAMKDVGSQEVVARHNRCKLRNNAGLYSEEIVRTTP